MVAGPNGAGKTTLTRLLRKRDFQFGEYINPDEIADELEGSYNARVLHAQIIADRRRDACLQARRSFSFETVMSHPSKVDILVRARAVGFFVQLIFVGTDDPRTNVERVALRVAQGGHDVPEDRIVARWKRTMELLHEAVRAADQALIFDNSAAGHVQPGPRMVLGCENAANLEPIRFQRFPPIPEWVSDYVLDPLTAEE
jgi:predicted ABC-type ATPase